MSKPLFFSDRSHMVFKRLARVVARLEALGWGEELRKHKDWYEGIQTLPPMSSSKPVTDKSTTVPQKYQHGRYLIIDHHYSLEHLQGPYHRVYGGSTGQTASRGTRQSD
jgi:hypothetical protein